MNKAIKIIVLFLSLALVAGLFVFLLDLDFSDASLKEASLEQKTEHTDLNLTSDKTINNDSKSSKQEGNEKKEESSVKTVQKPDGGWTQEKLAEQISKTVQLTAKNNEVIISYSQPEIPKNYHLTFKAEIFDENGKSIDRYISDAGWLSDINNYDPKEKTESAKMNVTNMNDKCAIISVKVGDSKLAKTATTYQLMINYDGSLVWNSSTWNAK